MRIVGGKGKKGTALNIQSLRAENYAGKSAGGAQNKKKGLARFLQGGLVSTIHDLKTCGWGG